MARGSLPAEIVKGASTLARLLVRGLGHRHMPVVIAVLGVVVMLPALNSGWVMDDVAHRALLLGPERLDARAVEAIGLPKQGSGLLFAAQELYAFILPEKTARYMDAGYLPWWTSEGLRVAFWRPLTSFTLWLDYRLYPDFAPAMHVHSILWFAALAFVLAVVYRRLIGPGWVAGLAALLYVLDDSYFMPVIMLANRNVLLGVFFGLLTFCAHRRWRRGGHWSWAAAACVSFALALLSAEAGIAITVYLFSYAIFLDEGRLWKRLASLIPYGAIVVIWRMIYNLQGYGTYGCGFYSDPVREPARYAGQILRRGPLLIVGQWFGVDAIVYNFMSESAKVVYWALCVALVCLLFAMLWPLIRNERVARFWFLGSLLAVLPVCAASPMNRNLFFVGIGGMALAALFLSGLFTRADWVPRRRLWRVPAWIFCGVLILAHVFVALLSRAAIPSMVEFGMRRAEKTSQLGAIADIEKKDVVVLNMPDPMAVVWMPYIKAVKRQPLPRSQRVLTPGFAAMEAARPDEHTLVLRARSGTLFGTDHWRRPFSFIYFLEHFYSIFRDRSHPLHLGDKVELARFSAEVTDVDQKGRPVEVRFEFAVPLEDESFVWLMFDPWKCEFLPYEIPPVGESGKM
jgi:hypothetical protein